MPFVADPPASPPSTGRFVPDAPAGRFVPDAPAAPPPAVPQSTLSEGDRAAIAALIGESDQTAAALSRVHSVTGRPIVGYGENKGLLTTVPAVPELPQITLPMSPVPLDIMAAGVNTAGGLAAGLTSPENIALLGGTGLAAKSAPVLGRAISGVFAADMGHSAIKQIEPLAEAVYSPDLSRQQKLEKAGEFAGTAAMSTMAALHAASPRLSARIADKTPEQQAKAIREEAKVTEDKAAADALTDAADMLDREIAARDAQSKAQADAQKLAEQQAKEAERAVKAQQKLAQDAQKAKAEALKPPEVPKSTQILQEPTQPKSIANVATEVATQTEGSPFALQNKLNELTAISAPKPAAPLAAPKEAPAVFIGRQDGIGKTPGFDLYNLTEDIPGHPKGSSVSRGTLEEAGFIVPKQPKGEQPNAIREQGPAESVLRGETPQPELNVELPRVVGENRPETPPGNVVREGAVPEALAPRPLTKEARLNDADIGRTPLTSMPLKAKLDELAASGITTYKGKPIADLNGAEASNALGKVRRGESLEPPKDIIDRLTERKRLPKRPKGEVAAAGPDLIFDLAHDAAIDVAILGIRAGRTVAEVVQMAVARFRQLHPNATDEQVTRLAQDIEVAHGYGKAEVRTEAQQILADAGPLEIAPGRPAEVTQKAAAKRASIADSAADKWADKVIAEGRQFSGLDPEQLAAHTIKLAAQLEKGAVDFAEWSAAKIKEVGEEIRPYLQKIWDTANAQIKPQSGETRAQSKGNLGYDYVVDSNVAQFEAAQPIIDYVAATGDFNGGLAKLRNIENSARRGVAAARLMVEADKIQDPLVRQQMLRRLGAELEQGGTDAAQGLQARKGVNRIIESLRGEMAYLNGWQRRVTKAIGDRFSPDTAEKINTGFKQAGNEAAERLGEDTPGAATLLRGAVGRIKKQLGLDWKAVFTDLPENQAARKLEIFNRVKDDPKFAALPEAAQTKLVAAMEQAWESIRNDVFRREFGKIVGLPNIPKPDAVKLVKSIPEINKRANLGLLDHPSFVEALSEKYGIKGLDPSVAKRLAELGQEAMRKPEGIERNEVNQKIWDTLMNAKGIDPKELLNDYWFRNVMSDPSTGLGIGVGGIISGTARTLTTAIDTAITQGRPKLAMQLVGMFLTDTLSGMRLAYDLVMTGDRTLNPRYAQQFEEMLKRIEEGRPPGGEIAAIHRRAQGGYRAITAPWEFLGRALLGLDYVGSQGILQQQMIYAALKRGDKASLDKAMQVFNREQAALAEKQAREEMPGERWAVVHARTREILNDGIADEIKGWRNQASELNALNNTPIAFTRNIYKALHGIPFFKLFSKPLGMAFLKAGLNLFQESTNWMPITGQANWLRTKWGEKMGGLKDLPPEQQRHIIVAQGLGLMATATAASFFLGKPKDDGKGKPRGVEITGPQWGWTVAERAARKDEQPYSIRMPDGRYVSYKNTPMVGALAMVGHWRDQERYNGVKFDEDALASKVMNSWLAGISATSDLSLAQQFKGLINVLMPDGREPDIDKTGKGLAKLLGGSSTGLIPFSSFLRAYDNMMDPKRYPVGSKNPGVDLWLREYPFVRRLVDTGKDGTSHPALNMLGQPILAETSSIRRFTIEPKDYDATERALSDKVVLGMTPPAPSQVKKIVDTTTTPPTAREMTLDEEYFYGKSVREYLAKQIHADLPTFIAATPEQAQNYANKVMERGELYASDHMSADPKWNGVIPLKADMGQALSPDYEKIKALNEGEAAPSKLAGSRLRVAYDALMAIPQAERAAEYRRIAKKDPAFAVKLVEYVVAPAQRRSLLEKAESGLGPESRAAFIDEKLAKPDGREFLKDQAKAGMLTDETAVELAKRRKAQ